MPNFAKIVYAKDAQAKDLSDHHPVLWEVNELRGMTYNVQFLPTITPSSALPSDKKTQAEIKLAATKIAEFIGQKTATEKLDVICLQEVFDVNAEKAIIENLKHKGFVATKRLGGSIVGSGLITFCRRELRPNVELPNFLYTKKIDYLISADALSSKGVLHVQVTKDGKKYDVYNTHLQASHKGSRLHYLEIALHQIIELRNFIKKNTAVDSQTVVCGDFNIPSIVSKNNPECTKDDEVKYLENTYTRALALLGESFKPIDSTKEHKNECDYSNACGTLDLVFAFDPTKKEVNEDFLNVLEEAQNILTAFVDKNMCMFSRHGIYQMSQHEANYIKNAANFIVDWIKEYSSKDLPAQKNKLDEFFKVYEKYVGCLEAVEKLEKEIGKLQVSDADKSFFLDNLQSLANGYFELPRKAGYDLQKSVNSFCNNPSTKNVLNACHKFYAMFSDFLKKLGCNNLAEKVRKAGTLQGFFDNVTKPLLPPNHNEERTYNTGGNLAPR